MHNLVIPHETWNIRDASKLSTASRCPRHYFFCYMLGWGTDGRNIHFDFGTAWHKAMDVMWSKDCAGEAIEEAFEAFMGEWDGWYSGQEVDGAKNPNNAHIALERFVAHRRLQAPLTKVHTEMPSMIPLTTTACMTGRMDLIAKDAADRYVVVDHKSTGVTGGLDRWVSQWTRSFQIRTYIHALVCNFGEENVAGALINGLVVRNPPRMKKDGTPYANSSEGCMCLSVPVRPDNGQMQQWLHEATTLYHSIDQETEILDGDTAETPIMQAFPQRFTGCYAYFRQCPYYELCNCHSNPLRLLEATGGEPPQGFIEKRWNPAEPEED